MLRIATTKRNVVQAVSKFNNETTQNIKEIGAKFEEKVKGTFVENLVKYWKNVFRDYKDVVLDVRKDMQEKPIKAFCILSFLGSLVYFAKHNPDQASFRDAFVSSANQLLLVHPALQNSESTLHLKNIEQCYNKQTVRRLNIGIASVMWTDYYSSSCQHYQSNCPYLQLQYRKFKERILDIGFVDRWWVLKSKMSNYDINYL